MSVCHLPYRLAYIPTFFVPTQRNLYTWAKRKAGNILPSTTAAPGLQAQARELEKHMRADSLEQKIGNRPQPEVLIAQGILEEGEDPREP